MSPDDREYIATLGTTVVAVIVGTTAIAGGLTVGMLRTLELELLFTGTYLIMWWVLRQTTKSLRRPAPAPAPAPATTDDDTD